MLIVVERSSGLEVVDEEELVLDRLLSMMYVGGPRALGGAFGTMILSWYIMIEHSLELITI